MSTGPDLPPSPCLFWKDKNRTKYDFYDDIHSTKAIVKYLEKQLTKPTRELKNIHDVEAFTLSEDSSISVVGFFTDEEIQEDELEDFMSYSVSIQPNSRIYPALVTDPEVARHFMKNEGWYERPPSVVLSRPTFDANLGLQGRDTERKTYVLDEEDMPLKTWVEVNSLPLVTFLTSYTFTLLADARKPMAILFLDWKAGESAGVRNEVFLEELRDVAMGFGKDVSMVVADGSEHLDRMVLVGVTGGMSALPAFVMNGNDGRTEKFDDALPVNSDTLGAFIAGFLKGRDRAGASMALAASKTNKRNSVVRPKLEVRSCKSSGRFCVALEATPLFALILL